jgi:stress-induced morphogen
MNFEKIKSLIQKNLPDAEITVTDLKGSGDHFALVIKSDEFRGKKLLQQHRMVMDILKNGLQNEIHAVQIKTMTKEEK